MKASALQPSQSRRFRRASSPIGRPKGHEKPRLIRIYSRPPRFPNENAGAGFYFSPSGMPKAATGGWGRPAWRSSRRKDMRI